ncbi:MAG: sugar ABC transporter permease [Oscillospiraceae bacterium]|jgi:ABC-type sugar transport system permease subunit|nr:sugar ABC transporter permease [Oscillospiraceae bacterium]
MTGRLKKMSVERNRVRAGWLFMLPWLIGLVSFFIVPLLSSLRYSFSDVSISPESIGLQTKFVGLFNYEFILLRDAVFLRSVTDAVLDLLYSVPVVLVFSIFIGLLLNQKFRGRAFMRAVFFLPVIIASGVVMKIIQSDVFTQNTVSEASSLFQTGAIEEMMTRAGLPQSIVSVITAVTGGVFDLSWKSGIQILLFISTLQGVPPSWYEAASIEGANAWDSFWKITFPAISPTSLLVVVYTVIDSFTDVSNPVMMNMLERFSSFYYGFASASAMLYFLAVMLIIGLIFLVFSRRVFHNA